MHVIATAGHVDHGKSTLVRVLTGMEPDRWAEERRRGMTIDLGFAWTTLGDGSVVAFVDVPGHERFVPNMLAGVGGVPAAMIVVAADEGWKPQSAEHLAALDALDVRHGLLVVTRSDLADPAAAMLRAREEIAKTSLGDVEAVTVSGVTGAGIDALRAALGRLTDRLPAPRTEGPVRLWIDRVFTIRGAGTVVTGTLGASTIRVGDELESGGERLRVRGLQSMGEERTEVGAVARVAVNLRGADRERLSRGDALLTPGRFRLTDLVDVRVTGDPVADLPSELTLHAGSASVGVRVRPLGADTCRLRLARPLPLRLGDRALLRDPGRHRIAGGVTVLDVVPPGLKRRGAAASRAADLGMMDGRPDLRDEVRRRTMITRADLEAMGVATTEPPTAGEWFVDADAWAALKRQVRTVHDEYQKANPLEPGIPIDALRHRLGLPDRALAEALITPPLTLRQGRVTTGAPAIPDQLRELVRKAFDGLDPFTAPEAYGLQALGFGPKQIGAAVRTGLLIQLAPQVVLKADAPERAAEVLRGLPQPFTLSQARQALGTTRRVAVPLLELLDRRGVTHRQPDNSRTV